MCGSVFDPHVPFEVHQTQKLHGLVVTLLEALGGLSCPIVGGDDAVKIKRRGQYSVYNRILIIRLVLGIRVDDDSLLGVSRKIHIENREITHVEISCHLKKDRTL